MKGRLHINVPLFVLALVAALAIKVVVHESLQLSETTLDAPLRYYLPDDRLILEPVEQVKLRLRGPSNEIAGLNPFSVEVAVTLNRSELGRVEITPERLDVRMPGDFDIISMTPNRFGLEIEPLDRVTVPIRAVLTGEPAAGAYAGDPTVEPAAAEIRGPRSRIREVSELTVNVRLDRHAITFDEIVPLAAPDPLVRVVRPVQVTVHVPMQLPDLEAPNGEIRFRDTEEP